MTAVLELLDNEEVAPSKGLHVTTLEFTSTPDDNTVKIQFVRPQSDEILPSSLHPRRWHGQLSCFDHVPIIGRSSPTRRGRGHGRLPELDDAVLGDRGGAVSSRAQRHRRRLRFVVAQAAELRIDAAHIVVAGERRRELTWPPVSRWRATAMWASSAGCMRCPVHRRGLAAGSVPLVDRDNGS